MTIARTVTYSFFGLILSSLFAQPVAVAAAVRNAAPTTTILYSFTANADCGEPDGTLSPGPNGTFYGVTSGGWKNCNNGAPGGGEMFAMTPSGQTYAFSIAYSFPGNGNDVPLAPLTMDASGALYGVGYNENCGDIQKLTRTANGFKEAVVFLFSCGAAYQPYAGLLIDSSGAIYGTDLNGGPAGAGAAYRLTRSGSTYVETVLHAFGTAGDGAYPGGTLTAGPNHTFYGTTSFGGKFGEGIAYEVSSSGAYQKLYDFGSSPNDGTYPIGSLLMDNSGNLYGETSAGGKSCPKTHGCGTAFELMRHARAYTETTLHSFYAHGRPASLGLSGGGLVAGPAGELLGIFAGEQDEAWGVFSLKPRAPVTARAPIRSEMNSCSSTGHSSLQASRVNTSERHSMAARTVSAAFLK